MITLKIRKNVSLASLSTFRIGGRVKELVEVHSPDELIEALRRAQGRKFRVFAGGSNVVFPDEGLDCLLIRVLGGKIDYEDSRLPPTPRLWRAGRIKDSGRIIADAGVLLADVITFAIEKGLQGLETLSGIPGTVGGAVFGNAGAYGHSMMEAVEKVEVLDLRNCKRKWLTNGQCGFQYRHSILKEKPYLVLRVVLKLKKGDRKALETKSQEIIRVREKKYRPGIRCPGSFFKNVLVKDVSKKSLALVDSSKIIDGKIPAGWLLEQVGAKGIREGGIYIADFHGNLFVNDGKGTARDVKALARILKKKVLDRFGIILEEEVRYF